MVPADPPARANPHPPAQPDTDPQARADTHPPAQPDTHPPAQPDTHPPARADADPPLRADARRNRQRILDAARDAFAGAGRAVPLDEIAARAGVGPGTVYRHFPTKEALFQAIVRERVEDLVADASRRGADPDAGAAFFGFLARLGAEGAAKRDTSDAIGVPGPVRVALLEALAVLLERAQAAGAVRPGITAGDVVTMFKGLLVAVHEEPDPDRAARLFAVLSDGLRPPSR